MANQELNFNSDTETDASDDDETHHSSKHQIIDYDIVSLENTIVQYLQKLHFKSKSIKCVLGCIPSFDKKIYEENVYETPLIQKWDYSACIPFKN